VAQPPAPFCEGRAAALFDTCNCTRVSPKLTGTILGVAQPARISNHASGRGVGAHGTPCFLIRVGVPDRAARHPKCMRMGQPSGELTDRMRRFGRVEACLERGLPSGQGAGGTISLSPASIRRYARTGGAGCSPIHTRPGRIPTDTGLRLFVDGIMQAAVPTRVSRARSNGRSSHQPIEDALAAASAALSGLSQGRSGACAERERRCS
jgi:hypothetical protein